MTYIFYQFQFQIFWPAIPLSRLPVSDLENNAFISVGGATVFFVFFLLFGLEQAEAEDLL